MHYQFPKIQNISDVLPHIEGYPEFIVADKGDYIVINYVVSMSGTFDMSGSDDLGGAIRRECRGLKFYPDGKIAARPFHKFFNVGEREETQPHVLDLTRPHVLMEKMDGSMIHDILIGNELFLCTKMGVTDIAEDAKKLLTLDQVEWLVFLAKNGFTPILEYVSPQNQIVLPYEKSELVLLAIRNTVSGAYVPWDSNIMKNSPFPVVPMYGSVEGNIDEYITRSRLREGREGDIIRFDDGSMVKVKNDWYVRIHKSIERVLFDRNIVDLILNEELDDVLGMLPDVTKNRISDFQARFEKRLSKMIVDYDRYYSTVVASGLDRKSYALEWMPTIQKSDSFAPTYVFGRFAGKDGRTMILDYIKKHMGSNVKWDECARWMGL